MKSKNGSTDSYLYGSGGPQSDAHESRFQSSRGKNKSENSKKSDNTKNKAE